MPITATSGRRRAVRAVLAVAATFGMAITLSACGTVNQSASGSDQAARAKVSSDLNWHSSTLGETTAKRDGDQLTVTAGDTTIHVKTTGGLKVALFNAGMTTTYTQALADGVQTMAKKLGVKATVFDAAWDSNNQVAQIENAINSGDYNAFIVYAVEGSSVCKVLTKDAPAAGIAVLPVVTPLCGQTLAKGKDLYAPGTVSTIMGGGTVEFYEKWADYISSQITKPTNVVYVSGPNDQDVVVAAEKAVRAAAAKNPNFKLLDVYYSDYSSDAGLKATQNALVTHPGTNVILSHFSTLTIGILKALSDAGRNDVRVYDLGGDKTMKQPIIDGSVAASVPYFPYTDGVCSVDMLAALFKGGKVPQVVLSECGKGGEDTSIQTNVVVDKKNVNDFQFEY